MDSMKKAITGGAALLAAVVVVLGVFALRDDNAGKYQAEPSLELAGKAAVAAVTGEEVRVENGEVNSFLQYLLESRREEEGDFQILQAVVAANEDDSVSLYLSVTWKGIPLGLTVRGGMTFDGSVPELRFTPEQVRVGRLPVPAGWIFGGISGKLPEGIGVSDGELRVEENYLRLPEGQWYSSLELTSLEARDGAFYVKTTGVGDAVRDYALEHLEDWWAGLAG